MGIDPLIALFADHCLWPVGSLFFSFFQLSPQICPFRTAVPFWGHTTKNWTGLSPKGDCGPKRVNVVNCVLPQLLYCIIWCYQDVC